MARPKKTGLDYFPLDVDIFADPKVEPVSLKFGAVGEAVLIRLLCRIYREGYALPYDELTARSIAKDFGDSSLYTTVQDIVAELIKSGFFDADFFRRHLMLSSRGIQSRYEAACIAGKRIIHKVPPKHNLLDSKPPFTHAEMPQSKEENSKVYILDDVDEREDARVRVEEQLKLRSAWEQAFGEKPNPALCSQLDWRYNAYCDMHGMHLDVLLEAVKVTAQSGANSPSAYFVAVLDDWKAARLKTLDQVIKYQLERDIVKGYVCLPGAAAPRS